MAEQFIYQAVALTEAFPYQAALIAQFEERAHAAETDGSRVVLDQLIEFFQDLGGKAEQKTVTTNSGLTVNYKWNGFPDFDKGNWLHPVVPSVFIILSGSRSTDKTEAAAARVVASAGMTYLTDWLANAAAGIAGQEYTWHHHEVVGLMQYVLSTTHPHDHGAEHRGGANIWSIVTGTRYK